MADVYQIDVWATTEGWGFTVSNKDLVMRQDVTGFKTKREAKLYAEAYVNRLNSREIYLYPKDGQ